MADARTHRADPAAGSRPQARAIRKRLAGLRADLARLDRRVVQAQALRGDGGALARLDALAAALDVDAVAAHVRAAIAGAGDVRFPVPGVCVPALLPDDVFRAVRDAIPPAVFFEDAGGGRFELPVPPRTAPLESIVVWDFVARLTRQVIGPAVVERMRPRLEPHVRALGDTTIGAAHLVASSGRLVRQEAGGRHEDGHRRRRELLTVVVWLARAGAGGEAVTTRPNTALAATGSEGARLAQVAPEGAACVWYEFSIGPDAAGRTRLTRRADGS